MTTVSVAVVVDANQVQFDQEDIAWLRRYLLKRIENGPKPGDDDYSGVDAQMLPRTLAKVAKLWRVMGGDPTLEEILGKAGL